MGVPQGRRPALLEDRFSVEVAAKVKGSEKRYAWTAKMLRADAGLANSARFQGLLETEACFYSRFVPELHALGCPLPNLMPMVWADHQTLNHEVLILEDVAKEGFQTPHQNGRDGDTICCSCQTCQTRSRTQSLL